MRGRTGHQPLRDQVAVVTGANRGIGYAVARAVGLAGARIVAVERRPGSAGALLDDLQVSGADAIAVCADITDPSAAPRIVASAVERWGRLDLVVNNAGAWGSAPSESMPLDDWNAILSLNLTAPFAMCQAAAAVMLAARSGSIVNISSVMGSVAVPRRAAYSAAKAGLEHLTAVLAVEWASRGVRVNAVAPGFINSNAPGPPDIGPDYEDADIRGRTPVGRWGSVEEVAEAVVFLASPTASYITGHVLRVDGGWTPYGGWQWHTAN